MAKALEPAPPQDVPSELPPINSPLCPKHFWFDYQFEPSPGKRNWKLLDNGTWVEEYGNGVTSRFGITGHATVEGTEGTVVTKIDGTPEKSQTGNDGNFQVFIPDLGSRYMRLWCRNKLSHGWEQWKFLGAITVLGTTDVKVAPAAVPGPQKNLTIDLGGVTMDFVLIRPGSFTMGSDSNTNKNEQPAHKVTLTKPFYLAKYEVTQEQWEKVMGTNPSNFKGVKNPVEMVSYTDCQSFMAKLQEKVPGQTFRLPTEAEWEYACRAGAAGDYCYGDGEGVLAEYAWYGGNANNTTHPVGENKPNAWGLYDMHGNVWEWCADFHGDYPATAVVDPMGSSLGGIGARGGGWYNSAYQCRAAFRIRNNQSFTYYAIGVRLALTVQ
ncbi:MAG: formylglycine-generating enzyme family protein [Verrucomicrobiota bacterium]